MDIDLIYSEILNKVESKLGIHTTTNIELDLFCKKIFGNRFVGTFPSDLIPNFLHNGEMCILNLDKSDKPGSHWVALAKENHELFFYDSFGRDPKSIIKINKKLKFDKKDKEQDDDEKNCGQRCITFLIIGFYYGFETAVLI